MSLDLGVLGHRAAVKSARIRPANAASSGSAWKSAVAPRTS
jgi:hypothetical protein